VHGHQHKIVLHSDTGAPSRQVPFSARVQDQDLETGRRHCAQILVWAQGNKSCAQRDQVSVNIVVLTQPAMQEKISPLQEVDDKFILTS